MKNRLVISAFAFVVFCFVALATAKNAPVVAAANGYAMDYVYRYRNDSLNSFFYTNNPSSMSKYPTFKLEALVFRVFDKPIVGESIADANIVPIYRLYNSKTGTHLYTASSTEANNLPAQYSYYRNEGVIFYAYSKASGLGGAVHRFKNFTNNTYLFTDSESEKTKVQTILSSTYRYEGVAFRVEDDTQDNYHTVRVMTIGYNPVEGTQNLATRYFSGSWQGRTVTQQENYIFNRAINNLYTITNSKVNYKRVKHLNISDFPTYSNGLSSYTMNSYAKCISGTAQTDLAYCDARKYAFDYVAWAQRYGICSLINQNNIDEIWMLSSPYILTWENFMVGPTNGFGVNGSSFLTSGCKRHVVVNNPVYDRPDTVLHNYAHRVEATLDRLSRYWTGAEHQKYINAFMTLQQYDGTAVSAARCGNGHFPGNTNVDYKYNSATNATIKCKDFINFPNYTGASEVINCNAWGCDDEGWQKYWLKYLPNNNSRVAVNTFTLAGTEQVYRDWWKYILFPDILIYRK
jgi:hypothetical protein